MLEIIHNLPETLRNQAGHIYYEAFRRKLKRHFPRSVWTRIGIVTYATCSALLAREAVAASVTSGNRP